MLDLRPDLLVMVKTILHEIIPAAEVWAFGSRVTSTTKPYSDLDLAIVANEPVDTDTIEHLRDAFSNSDLPMRVDVVDFYSCSEAFKHSIQKAREVIQPSTRPHPHES